MEQDFKRKKTITEKEQIKGSHFMFFIKKKETATIT